MTVIINGADLRSIGLGTRVPAKLATLSGAAVHQLFTVAGGEVLITALWGVCTTAMAGANTLALQTDPTTGDTVVVVTATDLGTTDTAAGTIVGFVDDDTDATIDFKKGGFILANLPVTTGEIELDVTGAGADGAVQFYCTYVPLTTGASVVASA
jgi:hypothetical protein